MIKRNTLLVLSSVVLTSTALVLINWYFIPASRVGGIWILVGSSIGYSSIFIFGLITAIYALNELKKKAAKEETVGFSNQLPETDKFFTGRSQELQELERQFSKGKINLFGIHGMGGLGKTTLAIAFANKIARNYDHHLFLDMRGINDNPVTHKEAMSHVVRSFSPSFSLSDDNALLTGAYRSILNKHKVLILLDNVNDETQIQELIPPTGSILIVTSRTKFPVPHGFSVDLPYMSEIEARELLLKITDRITQGEADRISKLCGYLPNAIVKAGKSLSSYANLNVAKYIADLAQANAKVGMVEATTSLSFNLLNAEMKKHWSRLSVFPGDFGLEAASRILECNPEVSEEILFELFRLSLINVITVPSTYGEDNVAETRFQLHDLDRAFASSKVKDNERKALELRFAAYYDIVVSKLYMMLMEGGKDMLFAFEAFDREWKNIELAQTFSKKHYKTSEDAAHYCIRLGSNALHLMSYRLPQELLITWSETALRAARRIKDLVGEEKALSNLGTALSDAGRLDESIPIQTRAIEMARARGDSKSEATSLGNLGNVYRRKADLKNALEYHLKSYDMAKERNYVDLQPGEANNIGNVYLDLKDFDKALYYFQTALGLARNIQDLSIEANALHNIGGSYVRKGQWIKAIKYYRSALVIARKIGIKRLEHSILIFYSDVFAGLGLKIIAKKYRRDADKIFGI